MPSYDKNFFRAAAIIFFSVLIFDAVVWWQIFFSDSDNNLLRLYFLDVGQGDSEFIRFPGGVDVLIDGGPPNGKVLEELSSILSPGDTYIDIVIMSHPQLDHFGGLIDVLKKYRVGVFVGSGRVGDTTAYDELGRVLEERGVPYVALREGDAIRNKNVLLDIIGPHARDFSSKELNNTSLVAMLSYNNFRALYTGDIGFDVEKNLLTTHDLRADVLKVPHHGSKFSSGSAFLAEIHPKVAVIGVGKNSYGHPTDEAIKRLRESGASVFRTDQGGTIAIEVAADYMNIFQ
jgi:competence protein ComEC